MGLMTLVGFDDKKLNLIHVQDAVNGLYAASQKEAAVGQTYFLASEEIYTWPQIGKAISKAFGRNALTLRLPHFLVYTVAAFAQFFAMFSSKPTIFNLEKARDFVQKYWICDISKAKNELGFEETVHLEDGMKRTIDWYKKMKWL